jgi:hypothetical protein
LEIIVVNVSKEHPSPILNCSQKEHPGCPRVTANGIVRIAECCPMMQVLFLNCPAITDNAIIRIAECCPKLRLLQSRNNPTITDIALIRILECCPILKKLAFNNCPRVIDAVSLRKSFPLVKIQFSTDLN